ncbi:MAG: HNH endonuclease [Glutamicibacter arilaitensis]
MVEGQTECPLCSVTLNWQVSKLPNSAEVDHIVPHARGGEDTEENAWVICRRCNGSKGSGLAPKRVQHHAPLRNSGRF